VAAKVGVESPICSTSRTGSWEVGLMLRSDDFGISLVQARDESGGSVHGPSFIPSAGIVSVKELT
jgi:hypothetical protein